MMVPMGPGTVQGRVYIKPFMPKKSIKILRIQMLAIGAKTNGTKKTGLSTMGAANSSGSLTAKHTGTIAALPTARISWDLARKQNIKTRTSVAPVPPMQTTKYWAPWVRTAEACWPAWNAARLSVMLATRAAAMAGSTIEGPWTPTNQKRLMAP